MNTEEIITSALKLAPDERFELIDRVLHSLDRPDPELDHIWIEEAERRLAAYRAGHVKGIPAEGLRLGTDWCEKTCWCGHPKTIRGEL
jgi:putative addiction module component (TIGR02574 family)